MPRVSHVLNAGANDAYMKTRNAKRCALGFLRQPRQNKSVSGGRKLVISIAKLLICCSFLSESHTARGAHAPQGFWGGTTLEARHDLAQMVRIKGAARHFPRMSLYPV